MKGLWLFVLFMLVWTGFVGVIPAAQAGDAEHFLAAGLMRFGADIMLPDLTVPDVHGKDMALQSFRGQVMLINFWTTW